MLLNERRHMPLWKPRTDPEFAEIIEFGLSHRVTRGHGEQCWRAWRREPTLWAHMIAAPHLRAAQRVAERDWMALESRRMGGA